MKKGEEDVCTQDCNILLITAATFVELGIIACAKTRFRGTPERFRDPISSATISGPSIALKKHQHLEG
jgi:hypothetical protein